MDVASLAGRAKGSGAAPLTVLEYCDELEALDAALAVGKLNPKNHAEFKRELGYRLVAVAPPATARSRGPGGALLAVSVALTGLALAAYLWAGRPVVESARTLAPTNGPTGGAFSSPTASPQIELLARRVKADPNDGRAWYELARSHAELKSHGPAVEAYAKAATLLPGDAQLLSDYAEAVAMVNGRRLDGKPMELLQAALVIDPNHQRSLALAGTAAFNAQQYGAAIGYWQRLKDLLPADSRNASRLQRMIAQAREAAGSASSLMDAPPPPVAPRGSQR